ncbi:MAG: hypothetical protein H6728_14890 [Myxococcales bacterium]|nr:hypothetical protein [Myxococcales bacterium]MCB9644356.1 hypothetical protein [Myxococcales bacterium]
MTENKSWWERMRGGRKDAESQLELQEAQLEQQQERINSLEAELQKLIADLNSSHQEKAELNAGFQDKSRKLQDALDAQEMLEQLRKEEDTQLKQALRRAEESEKSLQQSLSDGKLAQEKLQKAAQTSEKLVLERDQLLKQLKSQEDLSKQLDAARKALSEREFLLTKQSKEQEALQQSLQKAQGAGQRVQELEKLLNDNTNRLIQETEKRKELEKSLEERTRGLDGLKDLQTQLQKAQAQASEKERAHQAAQSELTALQAEHKKLQAEHAQLQKQSHEALEKNRQSEASLAEATKKVLEAEKQVQMAKKQAEESEASRTKDLTELQRKLDVAGAENQALLEKLGAASQQGSVGLEAQGAIWRASWLCATQALQDICGKSAPLALWRAVTRARSQTPELFEGLPKESDAWLELMIQGGAFVRAQHASKEISLVWQPSAANTSTATDALLEAPVFLALSMAGCHTTTVPQATPQKTQDALWEARFSL